MPELENTFPDSLPSKKTRATEFELSIKSFLEKLQFDNVDGARDNFLIGGVQVDSCGGHEDTLLVVECTMKQTLGKKSLRDKIGELRGKIEIWERGFRKEEKYKVYKRYRYILALKNIEVRHEDIHYANESPRIYLWDDNFLDYYDDLFLKIRHYAKFNLLGEVGVKPEQQNKLQIPASMVTFDKTQMFLFFVDPRFLLEVSYVARRETRNERYYQRIINKERLRKISTYVNTGHILPNNIIIAFGENVEKGVKFHEMQSGFDIKIQLAQFGVKYGILEFPKDYRSCWVIDGQHRLYSFIDVTKLVNVPIVAFKGLPIEKQGEIFLDINKFQKPVSADLVWDLNGDMIPSEPDGIISNVVKDLNSCDPLYHKIYIPSKGLKTGGGLIKMASLCLSIKRMKLSSAVTHSKIKNPYFSADPEVTRKFLVKGLVCYFECLKKVLPEDWSLGDKGFILTDGAFGVTIKIFDKILDRCRDKGCPDDKDFIKYLSPLKELFEKEYNTSEALKQLRLSVTSEGGKANLAKHFLLYIRTKVNDGYFGGDIEALGIKEFITLEKRLKELIKLRLKDKEGFYDWLHDKISEDVYGQLKKAVKPNTDEEYDNMYRCLNLSQCFKTLYFCKDIFYPCFRDPEFGFEKDNALEVAFEHVGKMRNSFGHDSFMKKKPEDDGLLDIYLKKINKCLDKVLDSELEEEEESEE